MDKIALYNTTDESENMLTYGYDIAFLSAMESRPPHYHMAMEVIYITQGQITMFVDRNKFVLHSGDLLVIDSMRVHELLHGWVKAKGIIIEVSKKYMRKFIPDFEFLLIECCSLVKEMQSRAMDHLCQIMKDLLKNRQEKPLGYLLRSNSLVMELLAILIENYSRSVLEVYPEDFLQRMERMGQIVDYAEENYMRPVSLQEAADHIGLNREYFCRYFKKTLGCSFMEYLSNVRLNHIFQDLLRSEDPIQVILERNGFSNQKLFYIKFREKYGCTPTELRKTIVYKDAF